MVSASLVGIGGLLTPVETMETVPATWGVALLSLGSLVEESTVASGLFLATGGTEETIELAGLEGIPLDAGVADVLLLAMPKLAMVLLADVTAVLWFEVIPLVDVAINIAAPVDEAVTMVSFAACEAVNAIQLAVGAAAEMPEEVQGAGVPLDGAAMPCCEWEGASDASVPPIVLGIPSPSPSSTSTVGDLNIS